MVAGDRLSALALLVALGGGASATTEPGREPC
jgi:hypothetical protein